MTYKVQFLIEAIPGFYFKADDPQRHRKIREVTIFQFYSEPRGYWDYNGWCVIPFRNQDPKISPVGILEPISIGGLEKNTIGQTKNNWWIFNHDPNSEKFSRHCYAIPEDKLLAKLEEMNFVFDPENIRKKQQSL